MESSVNKIKKYFKDKDTTIKTLAFMVPFGMLIVNFIFYPYIPEDMPMQFTNDGAVVYTLPKLIGVFAMPSVLLLATLYMKLKKRITWLYLAALLIIFFMNIYVDLSIIGWL